MSAEHIKNILIKCIDLLEYTNKDPEVSSEYLYWINWLRDELLNMIHFSLTDRIKILTLIESNIFLKEDLQNYM